MIDIVPTEFEAYDTETKELLFKLEMFDADASEISIKTCINPDNWPEISDAVMAALKQMHPEKK